MPAEVTGKVRLNSIVGRLFKIVYGEIALDMVALLKSVSGYTIINAFSEDRLVVVLLFGLGHYLEGYLILCNGLVRIVLINIMGLRDQFGAVYDRAVLKHRAVVDIEFLQAFCVA